MHIKRWRQKICNIDKNTFPNMCACQEKFKKNFANDTK